MSQADQNVYRRRRLFALVAVVVIAALAFLGSQLVSAGSNTAEPEQVETAAPEATAEELTNCQPGVVTVEAFIGNATNHEALVNIPEGQQVFVWYEITNTGLVDCIFDVGTYATFFTISSGEQVYYTSRDCDRSNDVKLSKVLKANVGEKSETGEWLKVYSSGDYQCTDANQKVPTGGAAYDIKVEVSGVISEKKRFYLF